jgi:hypothetical protein
MGTCAPRWLGGATDTALDVDGVPAALLAK